MDWMSVLKQAWDIFWEFIGWILSPIYTPLRNGAHWFIDFCFGGFESTMEDAFDLLVSGSDVSSHLGATAQIINDSITPIAYTLLACGFVWELYEMWQRKQDNIDFKDIVKVMVKLLIIKSMIPFLPAFLDIIRGTIAPIYTSIMTNGEITFTGVSADLASTLLPEESSLGNLLWLIPRFIGGIAVAALLWLMSIIVYATAYIRDFEIAILNALSAIPLIFVVYSDTKDVLKRFLFAYATVVLQGLLMIIVFIMYNSLLVARAGEGFIALITSSIIAFMAFKKCNEWAGKILGQ